MSGRDTLKDHLRESHLFNVRALTAIIIILALLALVMGRLIYLQIVSHERFTTLSEQNRIDLTPLAPLRGIIYDRNGILLAQNLPAFSLELLPEKIENLDATLAALGKVITVGATDLERFKQRLKKRHPFEPMPLRTYLSDEEVARFAVQGYRFPGVEIQSRLARDYPFGAIASHAIGYVGRIDETDLKQVNEANYRDTTHIGKTGAEKSYEHLLHGIVGYQEIETNALGRALRVLNTTAPTAGYNLYLSLDITVQITAEHAFQGRRGAAVAINPKTGEVLALASLPGFDPNAFVNGIAFTEYQALQDSPARPLYNRALRGQYPPGSTVKPFMGLAGLEYQEITTDKTIYCPGWFQLEGDDRLYRDWRHEGHGMTDMASAIQRSCDVYFYKLAQQLGIDRMHEFMSRFGFGQPTGIDAPGELAGLMPSRAWKRKARREAWFPGETLITGIGQGFTLTTPLQLAEATATLGNRGIRMQPRMLHAIESPEKITPAPALQPPQLAGRVPVKNPSNWEKVIDAMMQVVHTPQGTAQAIGRNAPYHIAGKTGTAQVFGLKQDEKYKAEEIAEHLRDHALFIAFAPAENPRIAVAVIVENGGSGGAVAAPIARAMMDTYLLNNPS